MRPGPTLRLTAVITLLVFGAACVSTKLPPISSSGVDFQPLKDERKMWQLSRDEEAKLRDNTDLYQDPLLEDYLEDLVGRLNSEEMAANPELGYTVSVIENPRSAPRALRAFEERPEDPRVMFARRVVAGMIFAGLPDGEEGDDAFFTTIARS